MRLTSVTVAGLFVALAMAAPLALSGDDSTKFRQYSRGRQFSQSNPYNEALSSSTQTYKTPDAGVSGVGSDPTVNYAHIVDTISRQASQVDLSFQPAVKDIIKYFKSRRQDVRAVPRRGEQVGEYESIPSRYRGSVNGGRRRTHLMDPDRTLTEGPAPLTEDPAQTELRMRRQQQQHNDLKEHSNKPSSAEIANPNWM